MKHCPKCGNSLDDQSIYCAHCNNWLDNEIFDKLTERDVSIIKKQNLVIQTPSLFLMVLYETILKKQFKNTIKENKNESYLFNLLVFKAFIWFHWGSFFARYKQGKYKILKNSLKELFIELVANVFFDLNENSSSIDTLREQEHSLFQKFDDAILKDPPYAASELASIVYNEPEDAIKGFFLYTHLTSSFEVAQNGMFSEFFLIEEDWDWQKDLDNENE